MPEMPVPNTMPAVPGANKRLWARDPVLRSKINKIYGGRIFIEVWEKDVRVVMSDPSLKEHAVSVLQGSYRLVKDPDIPLTNHPATGEIAEQLFLGRVVVEMWDDEPVVAIQGSDPQILQRALQTLIR